MSDLSGITSALTVEDGTGIAAADSYISLADADLYVQDHYGGGHAWLDFTDDQREGFLRRAAQYLDSHYFKRWKGIRTTTTQALEWPRSLALYLERPRVGIEYATNLYIEEDEIPTKLKEAQVEAAILLSESKKLQPVLAGGESNIKKKKVGPIEVEYDTRASANLSGRSVFVIVDELLHGLVLPGGRLLLG